MKANLYEMARKSYGYGRWDSPHWFIGPEQGMGAHERSDLKQSLERRCECWGELGGRELNDCREFHQCIGEMRWHFKKPKVDLQPTWRPLMLLLTTFIGTPTDNDRLRAYQRDRWGALDGETCVIELSGLAAPNAGGALDTIAFRQERIQAICQRMLTHRPKLVIMYGRMQMESWNAIAKAMTGRALADDSEADLPKTNILVQGCTTLCCTQHPSRPVWDGKRYLGNEYWTRLGLKLRNHPCHSR
jgi:hypothetical protein